VAPAAAMVGLLQAADKPRICSGKSLVSGLRTVPLPSSGRTQLAVRLTAGDPASSPVSGLKMASSADMPSWKSACLPGNKSLLSEKMITSRTLQGRFSHNLQV
jgi:hypothetical protein